MGFDPDNYMSTSGRGQLKYDGTRAETRFRLSRETDRVRFNRRGRQFSRLLAAEVCASAVVMLDAPCSIRQFPLHFPYSASPCALTFQLESANKFRHQIDRNFRHRSSVNVWSTTVKGKLIGLFVLNIRATAEAYIACKLEQFYFEGRGRVQLNFDGTP